MTTTMFEMRLNRAQDLRGLRLELGLQVEALDPDAVLLCDALALWEELDAVERSAASAKTLLAARVAEANTWKRAGCRSAAEQLARAGGTSISVARNMLETSKQVKVLPATAAAMRAGRLSVAKAEVIASAATVNPDAEAELLDGADEPLAAVRDKCLAAKGIDRDRAHARIKGERCAREYLDKEGAWNFRARGTTEAGAAFRVDLDPIIEEMFTAARAEGREEPREAFAFDALMEMARRAGPAGRHRGNQAAEAVAAIHGVAASGYRSATSGQRRRR